MCLVLMKLSMYTQLLIQWFLQFRVREMVQFSRNGTVFKTSRFCTYKDDYVTAQVHHQQILSFLGFFLWASPQSFKTNLLKERFPHSYKKCFPSPIDVFSHNPPPFGSASLLAHHPMIGSDTFCNYLSPPLADIIFLGLSLQRFKTRLFGRGFHTLTRTASPLQPMGDHID